MNKYRIKEDHKGFTVQKAVMDELEDKPKYHYYPNENDKE